MILRIILSLAHKYGKMFIVYPYPYYRKYLRPARISALFILQSIIMATAKKIQAAEKGKKKQKPALLNPEQVFKIPEEIKKNVNKSKMVLVMDLDETMVQTRKTRKPTHGNYHKIEKQEQVIYVEYRPFIKEFLAAASEIFTIYVYTAGTQGYADQVINSIPNSHLIQKRFYRENCKVLQGTVIKDLKTLKGMVEKGDQKTMILVDDNCKSIRYNSPYSIRIKGFEGDQRDKSLLIIFKKLIQFYKSETEK